MRRIHLSTRTALGLCFFSTSALAQPATNTACDVETIVITGTKTPGVDLSRSAVGASVLDAVDLAAARIDSVGDLTRVLPNLNTQRLGQVGGLFLTVRGIASNPFVVNRVAFYVDDVPYRELNDLLLEDLARVEFLRGPQSALYGLNPEAGAVVVSSAEPGATFEGNFGGTYRNYASSGGVWAGRATLSGPLSDGLSGRLTLTGTSGDAFNRNLGAIDGRPGEIDEVAARGRLFYDLSERLSADLTLAYERLQAPGVFEQEYLPIDRERYNSLYADLYNRGVRLDRNQLFLDAQRSTDERNANAALRIRYALDDVEIVSVSTYRKEEDFGVGAEFDLTGLPLFRGADRDDESLFSQELRATSRADANIKWLVGLSYFDEQDSQRLSTQNLSAGEPGLVPASDQTRDGEDLAVFGQAILPIATDLRLTLGGRYERAERGSLQREQVFNLPTGVFTTPAVNRSRRFEAFLPKAALEFDLADNLLLYGVASQSWLPGGFNLSAISPDIAQNLIEFDDERLTSFEVGIKGQSDDGRLQGSAALFQIDADNWQEFALATTPTGAAASTTVVTSFAEVRSRGAEAELNWYPGQALDLGIAAAFTDSEYARYPFSPTLDYTGNRPAFAPEYEFKARATWNLTQNLAARAILSYQGDTPLTPDNTVIQPAYLLVDASVSWTLGQATATLFAENLTNRSYFSGLAFDNFAFGRDGVGYAPVGAPRSLGLEFEMAW